MLNFVPSAKETEGRLALAMLEVRGMEKGCETSSELKAVGSESASLWGDVPACSSAPVSSGTPSLGGTEYSGPSLSVSKEEKELSEAHAADGDSMKLGLKGISASWWETVTLGSLELLRAKQGIIALILASTPCTWCFILATTSSSGTAALSLASAGPAPQQQQTTQSSSRRRGMRMAAARAAWSVRLSMQSP